MPTKTFLNRIIVFITLPGIFFVAGWWVKSWFFSGVKMGYEKPVTLRLGGYQYTSPLLVCDADASKQSIALDRLKNHLQNLINQEIKNKNITTASVYFRDLKTGSQIEINGEEKFYPSSLRKVPLMMGVLKAAEPNPDLLGELTAVFRDKDQNFGQEIKPAEYARFGKTYTLSDLLEKMIKYSDNNATLVFTNLLGIESIKKIYNDLQVPFLVPDKNSSSSVDIDFMTANKFAFFFRVLFNSTYLNGELSDKALKLLTNTDFNEGLVSGVPQGTVVAHKFGFTSFGDKNGRIIGRELHDCGIVYHPQNPYLLCVMTKSVSGVSDIEKTIKNISATTYREFDSLLKK